MNREYRCAASSLTLDDDCAQIDRTIFAAQRKNLLWEEVIKRREEEQKCARVSQYTRQLADKEIDFQKFAELIFDMI